MIKENLLTGNRDGIDCAAGSVGNTVKENQFRDNSARGIMLRGGVTDNVIKENTFAGNFVGILVFAGVENTIKENRISASTLAGIRVNVFASGNLILENSIFSNPAGIEFLVTPTGSSTGNVLVENRIAMNACGLKGPTDGKRSRKTCSRRTLSRVVSSGTEEKGARHVPHVKPLGSLVAMALGRPLALRDRASAAIRSAARRRASTVLVGDHRPYGDVHGVLRGGTCTYLGVPYAAPPVGNLRWRPPQPRAPWAPATLNATVAAAAICPQINLAGARLATRTA